MRVQKFKVHRNGKDLLGFSLYYDDFKNLTGAEVNGINKQYSIFSSNFENIRDKDAKTNTRFYQRIDVYKVFGFYNIYGLISLDYAEAIKLSPSDLVYSAEKIMETAYQLSPDLAKKADAEYEKHMDDGEPYSYFSIGYDYYDRENFKKAFSWFSKGAGLEEPNCQFYLGELYSDGRVSGKVDFDSAGKWYAKAAAQGHECAADELRALKEIVDNLKNRK